MSVRGRRPSSQASRADALAGVRLFERCSKKERLLVAKLARDVDVEAGELVCEEGRLGGQCFVVLDGTASVIRGTGRRARVLREIGPGAAFGELALLDARPRTATVRAETPMRLLALDPQRFAELIERVPSVGHKLLVTLAWRVRGAEAEIDRLKVTIAELRKREREARRPTE
jgi:CRP-like cAMP-binding protein